MKLTAAALESKRGAALRLPPLSDCTSVRYLFKALAAQGIEVTEAGVRQWWLKYRQISQHSIRYHYIISHHIT